jgi:hypothetical protein
VGDGDNGIGGSEPHWPLALSGHDVAVDTAVWLVVSLSGMTTSLRFMLQHDGKLLRPICTKWSIQVSPLVRDEVTPVSLPCNEGGVLTLTWSRQLVRWGKPPAHFGGRGMPKAGENTVVLASGMQA